MKTILLLLPLLYSCTTSVRTLGTRMISPEGQGKIWSGSLDTRLQGFKFDTLDFQNDRVNDPLLVDGVSTRLGILGELGLLRKWDFFYLPSVVNSPSIFGVKFQLLGAPRSEAHAGNFSLSLTGGYGQNSRASEGDEFFTNVKTINLKSRQRELGLILGYRWTEWFLNYANVYHFEQRLHGTVTTPGTLVNAPFGFFQEGQIYSLGGVFSSNQVQFKVDVSHMLSAWSRSGERSVNTLNGGVGFTW